MKSVCRFSIRIVISATVLLVLSAVGYAQTSGTATINGSVGNSVQLTSGGLPTVTGTKAGTAASTQSAQDTAFSATINLGDVSPSNLNALVKVVMPLQIRSNINYTLSVQRGGLIAAGAGGGQDISAGDIGFGVQNVRARTAGSPLLTATAVSGAAASGTFGNDPSAATINADGQPSFATSLNDISTATTTSLLTGPRVSKGGGLNSARNAILFDVILAVAPQFFTPAASFTETVTVSIVSGP